jgi:Tfp pilus assembly protein PilZ
MVAEMENIGTNGAFIRCDKPLRPKERFKLLIVAPNHSPLSASAEVAWLKVVCSDKDLPPCGMGIRFIRVSSTVRQFIRALLRRKKKKIRPVNQCWRKLDEINS